MFLPARSAKLLYRRRLDDETAAVEKDQRREIDVVHARLRGRRVGALEVGLARRHHGESFRDGADEPVHLEVGHAGRAPQLRDHALAQVDRIAGRLTLVVDEREGQRVAGERHVDLPGRFQLAERVAGARRAGRLGGSGAFLGRRLGRGGLGDGRAGEKGGGQRERGERGEQGFLHGVGFSRGVSRRGSADVGHADAVPGAILPHGRGSARSRRRLSRMLNWPVSRFAPFAMRRFTLFPAALVALGVAGMGLAAGRRRGVADARPDQGNGRHHVRVSRQRGAVLVQGSRRPGPRLQRRAVHARRGRDPEGARPVRAQDRVASGRSLEPPRLRDRAARSTPSAARRRSRCRG